MLFAVLAGCASPISIDVVDDGQTRILIVASAQETRAWVLDEAATIEIGLDSPTRYELLAYDEPVERLRLERGRLALTSEKGRPIPRGFRRYVADSANRLVSDWTRSEQGIAEGLTLAGSPCAGLVEFEHHDLGIEQRAAFAFETGGAVWIGTQPIRVLEGGELKTLDPGPSIRDALPANPPIGSDHLGRVFEMNRSGDRFEITELHRAGDAVHLAGSVDKLFMVSDEFELTILDSGTETHETRFSTVPLERVDVAQIGPDEALFVGAFGEVDGLIQTIGPVVRYRQGAFADEPITFAVTGFVVAEHVDPIGTFVGAGMGQLFHFDGTWSEIDRARTVDAIAPFLDGILYSGEDGYIGQWDPGFGVCPKTTLDSAVWTDHIVVLKEEVVTVGRENDVTFVRRFHR